MTNNKIARTLVNTGKIIFLTGLLSACATPPEVLEKYPVRFIDRPYTLPEGLAVWKPIGVLSESNRAGSSKQKQFEVFPWHWKQGLGNGVELIWFPLPLEVKVDLSGASDDSGFAKTDYLGLDFNLIGPPHFRTSDFNWSPYLQLDRLQRVNEWFAFQNSFLAQAEIRRVGDAFHFQFEFISEALFQVTEKLAAVPRLEASLEEGAPKVRTIGYAPLRQGKETAFRFPLGLGIHFLAHRKLELSIDYRFLKLGYDSGYSNHQGVFSAKYLF